MRDHGLLWWPKGGAAAWRGSVEGCRKAGWWRRAEAASVLPETEHLGGS